MRSITGTISSCGLPVSGLIKLEPLPGTSVKQDQWLQVSGLVDVVSFDGHNSPLIHASAITVVTQPAQPYLYP